MPDFDTRRPQVPSRPNRLRVLFNGGTLLYVLVVASTVGLLIDAFSELAPQPTALAEAPNGTIAFETTRDFPYDQVAEAIWVMNANGSELSRLMGAASPYSAGWSISPDGEKIAFTEELYEEVFCNNQAGCPEKVHAQINVMNADGSYHIKLVEGLGRLSSPDWSPDGQQIAFGSYYTGDTDTRPCVIYTMNASGWGDPAHLTNFDGCYGIDSVAWSPDGKKIAIEVLESGFGMGDNDIYVVDVPAGGGTNQPRQLTKGAHKWWNVDPAWSPDSTEIAFIHMDTADMEPQPPLIYKMNADGSGKTQLVPDGGYEVGNPCQRPWQAISPGESLAWSPEGENIAFVDADNFVCVVNADGSGHPTLVRRVQSEAVRNLEWIPPR